MHFTIEEVTEGTDVSTPTEIRRLHDLPETWPGAIAGTDAEFCGLRLEVCGIGSNSFWDIHTRI
jgi:hypothetical protein